MTARLIFASIICVTPYGYLHSQLRDVFLRREPLIAATFGSSTNFNSRISRQAPLVFPGLLEKEALNAGNPLATYAAMLDMKSEYLKSGTFAAIYPEIRANFEEFLGFPMAGVQAMSLPAFQKTVPTTEAAIPPSFKPEHALKVIEREAGKTRIVVLGEEHHLPQTRSLYEPLLRALWQQGYRYLAAETFADQVMNREFKSPDYNSGYYLLDPVFASAVRTANDLGYKLIAYDTRERDPNGGTSFRDRRQAENIKQRIFDRDPHAKVLILAGRGHASEEPTQDGWTPMASVLKRLTGIDPLTVYTPTMSQRLTPEEEDPLYRFAISRGLVKEPTIFSGTDGRLLGSDSFDAYVFWPRIRIFQGRPDWMEHTLGRKRTQIPGRLRRGKGLRLVQAFREGDGAWSIPVDQVVLDESDQVKVLMLPPGRFWLRTIDRTSRVIATSRTSVP